MHATVIITDFRGPNATRGRVTFDDKKSWNWEIFGEKRVVFYTWRSESLDYRLPHKFRVGRVQKARIDAFWQALNADETDLRALGKEQYQSLIRNQKAPRLLPPPAPTLPRVV